MNSAKNCFTLPQNASFLRSLAGWIINEYDKTEYARILILLPNRRSCRALREAFLDITGGEPLLLPRIQPIGEVENEAFFADITKLNIGYKQPVDPVRRHFLLMKLIMRFQQGAQGGGMVQQAAELAKQLADLLDEVARENLSFSNLESLAPENLAEHWQKTLDFLTIITRQWPDLLDEEGVVDIVPHRNQMLFSLAEAWRETPPDYPVIAAGSTGSQPATAGLLKVIANLPQGKVILPALDKIMEKKQWDEASETHPQYGLKKLLEKFEIGRDAVKFLVQNTAGNDAKEKYISAIFAPAESTSSWANVELPDEKSLSGIRFVEADTLQDEARAIAISMRSVLEIPEKTAALITPDRVLARMVSAQLQRFGVIVDDSAGKPLINSVPACFLRLVADMVANRFAPASLLALLRHPLAGAGINPAKCRSLSRELELMLLRGISREEGIEALFRSAAGITALSPELLELLRNIKDKSAQFSELLKPHSNAGLQSLLTEHIAFAQWFASSDNENGETRLWQGEAGNSLAEIIARWGVQAAILPPFEATTYPALFEALLAGEVYHSQIGLHPRLHILSPMEARLQSYDLVILSSLNEGIWPQTTKIDPWMSRPQRVSFGLPPQERNIGQSAHDFVMQLFAPEVLLTRARKVEGSPAIPSRWWVRMETLLAGRRKSLFAQMNKEEYFAAAKNIIEKPALVSAISAPEPRPPLAARPRKLRVTAIDALLKNPYNIYARYIIDLKKLEKIDREPDASDFGNLVHKALEIFVSLYPEELPPDIDMNAQLLAAGRKAFADFLDRPAVACLWWPRFVAMVGWFASEERRRRAGIEKLYSEVNALWNFEVEGKEFTLSTRIDRLEKLLSGGYALVDYKTGTLPSSSDIKNGISNQLPLEALIVQHGKLPEGMTAGTVAKMEYWKLSGNEEKCEIKEIESDIEATRAMLEDLIRKFDDISTAYNVRTEFSASGYNDYAHLARVKEWEFV